MIINSSINIVNLIKNKLTRDLETDYIQIAGFYKISFDFYSSPYPIVYYNNKPTLVSSQTNPDFLGHIIIINNQYFIVNKDGHFVLDDIQPFYIDSIFMEATEDVNINYKVFYQEYEITKDPVKTVISSSRFYPTYQGFGKAYQIYCNAAPGAILLNQIVSCIDIEGDCGSEILITLNGIDSIFQIGQTERLYLEGDISKVIFNSFKIGDINQQQESRDFYINYQIKE